MELVPGNAKFLKPGAQHVDAGMRVRQNEPASLSDLCCQCDLFGLAAAGGGNDTSGFQGSSEFCYFIVGGLRHLPTAGSTLSPSPEPCL